MHTETLIPSLATGSPRRRAAALVGLGVVGADLVDQAYRAQPLGDGARALLGVVALLVLWALSGRDRAALGLVGRLRPSGWFWLRGMCWLGALVLLFSALSYLASVWLGAPLPTTSIFQREEDLWHFLWHAVLVAPVMEELLYRGVLCSSLRAVLGPRGTIAVSGAWFGALHFAYANPGPDNFIAGYLLAWAYLRSGALWLPIALHAGGNLCVWLGHAYLFYWPI